MYVYATKGIQKIYKYIKKYDTINKSAGMSE